MKFGGGKAENLAILRANHINVPAFFILQDTDFDDAELDRLVAKLDKSPNALFSVRSSSSAEDGAELSFAGQFDTFLNVKRGELRQKISACFASLAKQNVTDYTKATHHHDNIQMSVIVQRMVSSDYSGVIFTANPQGIYSQQVIVVGRGVGENVVADKVNTTTYYHNQPDDITTIRASKNSPKLKPEILQQLYQVATKIRQIFDAECDIEYAIKDNEIFILQARPITTLEDDVLILDNSNLNESYPGLTLPLTTSFIRDAYAGVCRGAINRLGMRDTFSDADLHNMVRNYQGRMYYEISSWYHIIDQLPFSKKITPIWEESLGLTPRQETPTKSSAIHKAKIAIKSLRLAQTTPREMYELEEYYQQSAEYFQKSFTKAQTIDDYLKLYDNLRKRIFRKWYITLANDLYAFVFTSLARKKLDRNANAYLGNIANLSSLQPIIALKNICDYINQNQLRDQIFALDSEAKTNQFIASDDELAIKIHEYIESYGDRCAEELKLESPTFRTNPHLLIAQIQDYLTTGALDKLQTIPRKLPQVKGHNRQKILRRAQQGIKNRESSRLNRTRLYGMIRSIFLAIADILVAEKRIKNHEDIFHLTIPEIKLASQNPRMDLRSIIKARQAQYEAFAVLPEYHQLTIARKALNASTDEVLRVAKEPRITTKKLSGTPSSPGIVEAEAIIIRSPKDAADVKGKIIIAKSTDPGWVFLISRAKGIIVERGSLLSHTAIITRELHIPAIVGVASATSVIHSGDIIKLNANSGAVEILSDVQGSPRTSRQQKS